MKKKIYMNFDYVAHYISMKSEVLKKENKPIFRIYLYFYET